MRFTSPRSLGLLAITIALLGIPGSALAQADDEAGEAAPSEDEVFGGPSEEAPSEAEDAGAAEEPSEAPASTATTTTTTTAPTTSTTTAPTTSTTSTTSTAPHATTQSTTHAHAGASPHATGASPGVAPAAPPPHEEGDGRGADLIWIEVEGGVSYVNLVALENESFAGMTVPAFGQSESIGGMFGVAGGFRVSVIAVGLRGTYGAYPDAGFDIGTLGGEVHLRIPIPVVEPWIRVGAGYAWQTNVAYQLQVPSTSTGTSGVKTDGWTVNGALGFDIFLTWWLSIGIGAQVDFLNLTRQRDPFAPCMGITDFCPTEEGHGIGLQGRAFAQIGIHI